ncbi:MAG: SDR family NAD(P)-dependent oxidoreductase [Pseudomonadota bacterium]
MKKTILITGSTDGIGLEAAKLLVADGHRVLIHGRNPAKLEEVKQQFLDSSAEALVEPYQADLSQIDQVEAMAEMLIANHDRIDVLINNAGILKTPDPVTDDGLDVRFVVNTLAPYLLAKRLTPLLGASGRIVNLSSAAQETVNDDAFSGKLRLNDMPAYAQSKLAITMWTKHMADAQQDGGPLVVAVNPGSLLGTKMVKEGFAIEGKDIGIGSDILIRAALSDEFAQASGLYYDNDIGAFGPPHRDALDSKKCAAIVDAIESALQNLS